MIMPTKLSMSPRVMVTMGRNSWSCPDVAHDAAHDPSHLIPIEEGDGELLEVIEHVGAQLVENLLAYLAQKAHVQIVANQICGDNAYEHQPNAVQAAQIAGEHIVVNGVANEPGNQHQSRGVDQHHDHGQSKEAQPALEIREEAFDYLVVVDLAAVIIVKAAVSVSHAHAAPVPHYRCASFPVEEAMEACAPLPASLEPLTSTS